MQRQNGGCPGHVWIAQVITILTHCPSPYFTQGWTALHHACSAGRTEVLLPLLEHEHGADAFALNNLGLTAADIITPGSREVERLLERRGVPGSPPHALYNFAIAGGTQMVIALAEQAASQLVGAGLEEHATEARRLMEALQSPNQLRRVKQVESEIQDILSALNDGDSSTRWWREGATTTLGRLKERLKALEVAQERADALVAAGAVVSTKPRLESEAAVEEG